MPNFRRWLFIIGLWAGLSLACAAFGAAPTIPPPAPAAGDTPVPAVDAPPNTHPTVTPTETSPPSPTSAPAPCKNVLYPFQAENRWLYRLTNGSESSDIALTVVDAPENQAVINSLSLSTGVTTTSTVDCRDGAILNFPTSMLVFILDGFDGEIDLQYVDGVFVPAEADFQATDWNTTWETDFIANGALTVVSEGQTYTLELHDSPVHVVWRTASVDGDPLYQSITVPAGTFPQALEIRRQITVEVRITLNVGGSAQHLKAKVTFDHTLWYQPYVGLVRQRVDDVIVTTLGMAFPVETDAAVELIEAHVAP